MQAPSRPLRFRDRTEAGSQLAGLLDRYRDRDDVLVLGLPRGGVPVAAKVAEALDAPLDVFTVRKLGVPGHRELAMGAVATGGVRVINPEVVTGLGISRQDIEEVTTAELGILEERERNYRGRAEAPHVAGKTVIVVDDGLATGASMRSAVAALRQQHPAAIVVAVPVAARQTCALLQQEADEVVCALTPEPFHAVGLWYEDFSQTTDEEVRRLLGRP